MRDDRWFVTVGAVVLVAGCLRPAPQSLAAASTPPATSTQASIVAATVRDHAEQVKRCFTSALQRHTTANGRLALHWTINADGRATGMQIRESTLEDQAFSACLARAVESWRFPPPAGGPAGVDYRFTFE